ncbi:hypothetical protein HK096_003811 [Nowakowskiella sp. JEL0078]|nr:hypothetical protein HK096_003811 [Nowakowskiella sp. JEL0078]
MDESDAAAFLRRGILTQKRFPSVRTQRRLVMLCMPTSTDDLYVINNEIIAADESKLLSSDSKPARDESIKVLGQIALAAVSGTPILIIGTTSRQYIHFSDIEAILDEDYLANACNFHIVTSKSEVLRFSADSSVDYQLWISALRNALTIARSVMLGPAPAQPRSKAQFSKIRSGPPLATASRRSQYEEPLPTRRSVYEDDFDRLQPRRSSRYYDDDQDGIDDYEYYRTVPRRDDDFRPRRGESRREDDDGRSARSRSARRRSTLDFFDDGATAQRRNSRSVARYVDDEKWDVGSRSSKVSGKSRRRGRSAHAGSLDFMGLIDDDRFERRSSGGVIGKKATKKGLTALFREDEPDN